jgi:hypothetical protein
MPLPDYLKQSIGIPDDIDIDGHTYKVILLSSFEEAQYYDKYPSIGKLENGEIVLDTDNPKAGKIMMANAWVIFITLQKQCDSMKDDTFESFLKEMDDANMSLNQFVLKFTPLLRAIVSPSAKMLKKKD